MATAPLIHGRCGYSMPIANSKNASEQSTVSSSSSPCCSPSSTSNLGLSFSSGTNGRQRHQGLRAQAMSTTTQGKSIGRSTGSLKYDPDHLLVLVHGILASPSDWTYAEAELKRRVGKNFLIYASSSNAYTKTFGGIDEAGKRLADEVMQVVKKTESLKKISFLAHSLGGLFARYAISVHYSPNRFDSDQSGDQTNCTMENSLRTSISRGGMIAGLEPINFITLATPHLGVRGRKQLPFLLGVPILEKLAPPMALFFAGQTDSQLFLTDGKPNKPPLLLRMASDCEDGKFISALGAFRCRIVYANVSYDHYMVRVLYTFLHLALQQNKLYKDKKDLIHGAPPFILKYNFVVFEDHPLRSLDGYKHIVDVEYCPPVPSDGPQSPPEAAKAKEAAQNAPSTLTNVEYYEIMEEEMICGLKQLGWRRVDVSFHSAAWPFFAHNNIHVLHGFSIFLSGMMNH